MDSMVWPGVSRTCQPQSRKVQRIAVLHAVEGVFRLGAGAEMDGRAATIAQFQMASDKVGVEMGQEDVADLQAKFFGIGQVLLNVALRVDNDAGRAGLVSEQIGSVCQAAQVVLFENHRNHTLRFGGRSGTATRRVRWRSRS